MNISDIDYTSLINKYQSLIISAADSIWEYGETAFQEYHSSTLLKLPTPRYIVFYEVGWYNMWC